MVSQRPTISNEKHLERLAGIVERITFHNEQNGWSVLKVTSFRDPAKMTTVLIHQAKVFAGATMEFWGEWGHHPKHGEQFKAVRAIEKKPASAAALEKYLGSGLISGVGPATAKKIVSYFNEKTLEIFENKIEELMLVPGIAEKKLEQIKTSWEEHRAIRDVMIFLQGYGISTLFATKIYKTYGDQAIQTVSANPYRLAHDIYGIGFFSADKIALAMGFERTGVPRIEAGIKHVLSASREEGHCFLTDQQIIANAIELLREKIEPEKILEVLQNLLTTDQVKLRKLTRENEVASCYYSKGLYFDELTTSTLVKNLLAISVPVDEARVRSWVAKHCEKNGINLSDEQQAAVCGIAGKSFSILTGGPGCGKTTCTKALVNLLKAMKKRVVLAAPTGRAAQRMTEVIGFEAKTIHRLLEWAPDRNGFKRDDKDPIKTDFLIVDETSMLDISLAASLLKAVPQGAQVLFIGDPDQLPSVGAGDVLSDLLKTESVPRFRLTKVFRQAQASSIIRFAHEINSGSVPRIVSPLAKPNAFKEGHDCLFVDADEATQDQIKFIQRAKFAIEQTLKEDSGHLIKLGEEWKGRLQKTTDGVEVDQLYRPEEINEQSIRAPILTIPEKFKHVDLNVLAKAESNTKELMAVLKSVHPWSSLNYGLSAVETAVRLYTKTIPEWLGKEVEIQILTPQVRGTLGTLSLNESLQKISNPESPTKRQIQVGARILRVGDRVIQTRNNYDLGVFNGDIGRITQVDSEDMTCEVCFSGGEERTVIFEKDALSDLTLAYAITIHKSQGSEFQVVLIPVLGQHFNMLFRNLIYTGLTRAKKLAVFVGSRKAFAMAVGQIDNRKRQTALTDLIQERLRSGPR
ncbi:MAG: AAA family ATPase [Bdellovibrionaceae bacterium]|nr:AAA family ATPase [Pseudobdellovibrionaceae bacterium]